jgi:tRNA (cmo5U34)-methyltransferase
MDPFSNPTQIARYAEETPQRVPGYSDLHRMAQILLSEHAPPDARMIVLGAGGGLELTAFAKACPDWTFVGVDPSQHMLELAAKVLGSHRARVDLVNGYVADAPLGPFDGATCLLTLHFLSRPDRLAVLRDLNLRLKLGAPLVIAHHCHPHPGPVENWLARSVAFAAGPSCGPTAANKASAKTMAHHLTLLTPTEEEAILIEAGFTAPTLFYAALSFRGWVAYAS